MVRAEVGTPAVTQLVEIREMLRSDAGRRRRTRLVDGLLIAAVAAVAAGFAYYLLDRRLGLYRPARLFLDAAWLLPVLWIVWRRVFPALGRGEDEIDVALRYQRRMGIDSDLVAALEFDAAGNSFDATGGGRTADGYGSARLRDALVDQVDGLGPSIAESEEPPDPAVVLRMRILGAVLIAAVIVVAIWPRSFAAFVRRAALEEVAYPSATTIEWWTIDGRGPVPRVDAETGEPRPTVTVAIGRPAEFVLRATDAIPDYAVVELVGESGATTSLELTPSDADRAIFRGSLPAVVESCRGRFVAGDAFSETFELPATPLPLVTVTLEVTPPGYAAGVDLPMPPPGRLNAAVLEGSDVAVIVECANKELRSATLSIAGVDTPLAAIDETKRLWRADPAAAGLADIRRPIEFLVQAEDIDKFRPAEPLKGSIGLRPDLPPTVAAEIVTKWVLPAGKPSIAYDAADDLGIQGLAVTRQVLRSDGSTTTDRVEIPLVGANQGPATKLAGKFSLPLDGLQLVKGDKVTIRVEARDRRADSGRAVAQSEPHTLEVTDEQGLYEAMAETDQRSARKMDEIIQKQLMMTGRGSTGIGPLRPATPSGTPSSTSTPGSTGAPGATVPPASSGPTTPAASPQTPTPTSPPAAATPSPTVLPAPAPPAGPSVTNPPGGTTPSGSSAGPAAGTPSAAVPGAKP